MLTSENLPFDANDEKGEIGIVKDIGFTAGDGKFMVITDPNGGSKSIMAKLTMGIGRPTGGRVLFDGRDTADMSITDRTNLGISFTSQQPIRFKDMQAIDLFRLVARRKLMMSKARQYLAEVGFYTKDYINREANASLSGGEFKRTETAAIIARASKLSVFDEPGTGTDLWSLRNLIQVFERMRQNTNSSTLIISHQERILSIADGIMAITDDKVVNQGTRGEVMSQIMGTAPTVDTCSRFYETAR